MARILTHLNISWSSKSKLVFFLSPSNKKVGPLVQVESDMSMLAMYVYPYLLGCDLHEHNTTDEDVYMIGSFELDWLHSWRTFSTHYLYILIWLYCQYTIYKWTTCKIRTLLWFHCRQNAKFKSNWNGTCPNANHNLKPPSASIWMAEYSASKNSSIYWVNFETCTKCLANQWWTKQILNLTLC